MFKNVDTYLIIFLAHFKTLLYLRLSENYNFNRLNHCIVFFILGFYISQTKPVEWKKSRLRENFPSKALLRKT